MATASVADKADEANQSHNAKDEVAQGKVDSATVKPFTGDAAVLVKTTTAFIKKLEPWKALMTPFLLDDMAKITYMSKFIEKNVAPRKPRQMWTSEVQKGTMQDWVKQDLNLRFAPSVPGIQTFYRRLPQTSTARETIVTQSSLEQEDQEEEAIEITSVDSKNLQRIQINSGILRDELESIGSVYCPTLPLNIAPPYKLLLRFWPGIQSRLAELEEELQSHQPKGVNSSGAEKNESAENKVDETNPEPSEVKKEETTNKDLLDSDVAESDKAVEDHEDLKARHSHLKALHDLVQDELWEMIDLRAKITDGTLERIAFEDLWHLMEPGDVIISKDGGRDQLYKVYAVTGGQIQRRNHTTVELSELQRRRGYSIQPRQANEDEEDSDKQLREEASGMGTWTSFKIDCYKLAFDGVRYGPREVCKKIKHYVGERDITKLGMYPIRFHPEKDKILRDMENRGRKFLSSLGHKSYEGMSIAMKRADSREEVNSDVFIDFESYYQQFPLMKPNIGRLLRSRIDVTETSEQVGNTNFRALSGVEVDTRLAQDFMAKNRASLAPLEAEQVEESPDLLRLLPHQIVGYAFRLRKWLFMDIDLLRDIDEESYRARDSGFQDLVIPERYRSLLVALVENHASGQQRKRQKSKAANTGFATTQVDLVRGKGQGLIILLHGPPGSGKTSTAETIAAYTRRPLYSITCGDIGLTPDVVEERLLLHTQLADKWGCVLLLDEADVFLMQRDWRNMARNALVSVFLRQLEYYPGILFLTTNRPGVIDEAFKSRIHVSLRYPAIDYEATKMMWTNIMNRFERDNATAEIKVNFKRDELLEFAKKHYYRHEGEGTTWNGRQIRNAFHTALALAQYERVGKLRKMDITIDEAAASGKAKLNSVRLTKAHFQNIAKTAREFELYIEMLRGKDSDKAREEELRDDYNDPIALPVRKKYPAPSGTRSRRNASHSVESSSRAGASRSVKGARVEADESEDDEGSDDDEGDLSDEDD